MTKVRLFGTTAITLIGLMASGSIATPTLAQTALSPDVASPNEVVVTARRRSEKLQDVPLTVTALSSQKLQDAAVPGPAESSVAHSRRHALRHRIGR